MEILTIILILETFNLIGLLLYHATYKIFYRKPDWKHDKDFWWTTIWCFFVGIFYIPTAISNGIKYYLDKKNEKNKNS